MNDRLFLENLRLKCKVGTTNEERTAPQEVIIDISLTANLKPAAESGNIDDTINYSEVMQQVLQLVSNKEFMLLESLAGQIATHLLNTFRIERVTVKVRKAKYSSEPSIGVEIKREREPNG